MTQLVLLAYGRETEYRRAIFAVLSFWARYHGPTAEVQAVVFTDQPAFFEPYLAGWPVRYELLTKESLAAMQQPDGYVHRVKAAILAQTFQQYPADALLFVDSDTFFISSPDSLLQQLAGGHTFLHKREYTLAEAVGVYAAFDQASFPEKLLKLLASRTFRVGGAEVQFRPEQYSWNSGVLGLPAKVAPLMPEVLQLLDDMYAGTRWFTCEQIAFSLALQVNDPLLPSDQYVFHYWGKRQKILMDRLLQSFVTAELSALAPAERLRQVLQRLPRWWHQIKLDELRRGALYAFKQGQTVAGLKYAAKAWATAPFSPVLNANVWRLLRKKIRTT